MHVRRVLHDTGPLALQELRRACPLPQCVMAVCGGVFGFFAHRKRLFKLRKRERLVTVM